MAAVSTAGALVEFIIVTSVAALKTIVTSAVPYTTMEYA
jgi:hypothetical protein